MYASQSQVEELERQVLEMQPEIAQSAALAKAVVGLRHLQDVLAEQIAQIEPESMSRRVADMEAELRSLGQELVAGYPSGVPEPPIQDVRWTLPVNAAPSRPRRKLSDIRRIILHHSATLEDTTQNVWPERTWSRANRALHLISW